jgi:hypothetical protein
MAWYAQPRQTRDVDIVVELPEVKVEAIVAAFSADFYVNGDAVRSEVRRRGMFNMIENQWVVKVDMIVRKATPYDEEAFRRRRTIELQPELRVDVISREDLVLAKLRWAAMGESDLQMRDVRNLLSSGGAVDVGYLRAWAPALGVAERLREVVPE